MGGGDAREWYGVMRKRYFPHNHMYHQTGKMSNGIINHFVFMAEKLHLGGFRQMNLFLFFKKNLKTLGFIKGEYKRINFLESA